MMGPKIGSHAEAAETEKRASREEETTDGTDGHGEGGGRRQSHEAEEKRVSVVELGLRTLPRQAMIPGVGLVAPHRLRLGGWSR